MRFGVCTFVADGCIAPAALAQAVEERGLESLFLAEHTHMPVSIPMGQPGSLPDMYFRCFDPLLSLSVAATVTEKLVLGTSVCLVIQRDPILLAKEVATLDALSGGRFVFGVGTGWSVEEMRNHGTDPRTRASLMRERVLAMQEIWTHDEAEFHGSFVDFAPLRSWPKPRQTPHPPVFIGGSGPRVLERVLDYGDGWIPMATSLDTLEARVPELQQLAADAGRGPVPVTATALALEPDAIDRCLALGVERALFSVSAAPPDETMRQLDRIVDVVAATAT
jgi:probable F420-dependent oxidoreductase